MMLKLKHLMVRDSELDCSASNLQMLPLFHVDYFSLDSYCEKVIPHNPVFTPPPPRTWKPHVLMLKSSQPPNELVEKETPNGFVCMRC